MQSLQGFGPSVPSESELSPQVTRLAGFRPARFWGGAGILLALVVAVAVLLAVTPDADTRAAVSGLGQTVTVLFALGCSLWASRRVPPGRARWALYAISTAMAFYSVADILSIVFSIVQPNSAPLLPAILFLSFYFLLAIGVLRLPSATTTPARQVRLLLDVGIVIGALLGPALAFLIVPRFISRTPIDFVYIFYPLADASLVLVALVQLVRGVQQAYRPAFFWLTLGMLCFVYADTTFNFVTLPAYSQGGNISFGIFWIDPLWVAGLCAFSLAPLSLMVQGGKRGAWDWLDMLAARLGRVRPSRSLGQFFLLAVPVLVLFGLIIFSGVLQETGADKALEALTLIVVLLIIIRQLLTQHDLVDARIATERAEQLDALKDQFITSVNHELRTPLMTMQGYLELLGDQEAQATPEKRGDMLERARGACTNLVHLVRSILDTRRIEQEADNFIPEVVNVWEAAQAALSLMDPREANPAGRYLGMQISDDLVIWGDPVRVQQILTNLFSNAIKYSPPEAPITVSAQVVPERSPRFLGLGGANRMPRQMVEIVVQDKGLGIPPEQKELLFRRFVRLPREIAGNIHGNGLGLYLCRVFAEAMGGTISVESSGVDGDGSTFSLRLPLPAEENLPASPPPLAARAGR